jgi:putative copper export protein
MHKTTRRAFGFGHCGILLLGLLLVGGVSYLLLPEFRPQLDTALPFLLILLCPLMHLFIHHGHGKHQQGELAKVKRKE